MTSKFKSPFAHSRSTGIKFDKPSLTEQQFKNDADINVIVNRMQRGLFVDSVNASRIPKYAQVFKPNMYQEALENVAVAKSQFALLPSHIRKFFGNDPQKLVEFVSDDKNYDKAIELGLIDKPKINYDSNAREFVQNSVDMKTNQMQSKPMSTVTPDVSAGVKQTESV